MFSRQYCLVHEKKILYGPCHWNGRKFAKKTAGALIAISGKHQNVPIPLIPPQTAIHVGSGLHILMLHHIIPHHDPFHQLLTVQGDQVSPTQVSRIYVVHDRNIDEVREEIIRRIRQEAYDLLRTTDWLVIRALEPEGKAIPPEIIEFRRTIRHVSNTVEDNLHQANDFDSLKRASSDYLWPNQPGSGFQPSVCTQMAPDPDFSDSDEEDEDDE